MQKIVPYLWYDDQAGDAVEFYTSAFRNSRVISTAHYTGTAAKASGKPEGSLMSTTFELDGLTIAALNGGPQYTFSPALSFFVHCSTDEYLKSLWDKLSQDGTVLMKLAQYPFSPKFGWVQDRFGLSWQLNLTSDTDKIAPYLLFVGEQQGKAAEAMHFYISLFSNSGVVNVEHFGKSEQGIEGSVRHGLFKLFGQEFMCMDSFRDHPFTFTPAFSFLVNCNDQAEIDRLWNALTQGGSPGQCGWLSDRFGVSWQIVPAGLDDMLENRDANRADRVWEKFLEMVKIDAEELKRAFEG